MPTTPNKKKNPPPPPKPAAPAKATASATYDMASLIQSLGPPDEGFAARAFAGVTEVALLEQGTRTDSQNIVDDIPRFVGSALEIQKGLSKEQATSLRLPSAIFPLILREAGVLQTMKAQHEAAVTDTAGDKADREQSARKLSRQAMNERDVTYDAIRNALGDDRMVKVDAVVGTADTSENLARGIDNLAKFVEDTMSASEADAAALDDYGISAAHAKQLRATADNVRRAGTVTALPGRKVSQRALDIQDGRVLLLVERSVRAFRAARRADPSILAPELNKIAWMFETRTSSKPKPAAPKADAAKTDGAADAAKTSAKPKAEAKPKAGAKPEAAKANTEEQPEEVDETEDA